MATANMFTDGYSEWDVMYIWTYGSKHSIKMAPDMTLSQFDLIGFPHDNESIIQPNRGLSCRELQLGSAKLGERKLSCRYSKAVLGRGSELSCRYSKAVLG